jgi:hypothetical protein
VNANAQAAFEHIKAFLRHQPDRRVGRQGLRCQDVLDLIKDMKGTHPDLIKVEKDQWVRRSLAQGCRPKRGATDENAVFNL